jgi:hypothetical protein
MEFELLFIFIFHITKNKSMTLPMRRNRGAQAREGGLRTGNSSEGLLEVRECRFGAEMGENVQET